MPSSTFATSGRDLVGHRIDNGRLEFLAVLGIGAYGVVYLAVDLHAPKPVYLAVKCLLRAGLDSRQRHFQRREIALHQLASRHPNVVTLHKVLEEEDYIFVIMDFCDEGDLFGMITERQRYLGNDQLIKKVFLQIIDAVRYCHKMGIFHRDLKPENILCQQNGEKICIADFGLATSERYATDFGCGSTFYLSPECQGGLFERLESYSTETNDIWSLGVILVNMTCGRNPWRQACPNDETFRAYVHNPDFLRTILPISRATNRILKGMFSLEPSDRITLDQLREEILKVDTFTMTDDELKGAHSAARAAAAAVRPVPPASPSPATAPAPAVKVAAPAPQYHDITADEDLDAFAHKHDNDNGRAHARAHEREASRSWSRTLSAASSLMDSDAFAHIDFSSGPSRSPLQTCSATATATVIEGEGPTPALIGPNDEEEDPLDLELQLRLGRTTSRSSSSGDISLPPTPQFFPVDSDKSPAIIPNANAKGVSKTVPHLSINVNVAKWDLSNGIGKGKGGQNLHPNSHHSHSIKVNPQTPVSGEFIL